MILDGMTARAGIFAAIVLCVIVVLAVSLASPSADLPLTFAVAPCVILLGWSLTGAPWPASPLGWLLVPLVIALGGVSWTFQGPSYTMGSAALAFFATITGFVAIGYAATWLGLSVYARQSGPPPAGQRRDKMLVAIAMYVAVAVCGAQFAVWIVNSREDARPPVTLTGTVKRHYIRQGKSTAYLIDVTGRAANHATGSSGEYSVEPELYDLLQVGATVCFTVHTGRLHLNWWTVSACNSGS
jgi:hypothetical protein